MHGHGLYSLHHMLLKREEEEDLSDSQKAGPGRQQANRALAKAKEKVYCGSHTRVGVMKDLDFTPEQRYGAKQDVQQDRKIIFQKESVKRVNRACEGGSIIFEEPMLKLDIEDG